MRLKDIAQQIREALVRLTDDPFHVEIKKDDLGHYLVVSLENYNDKKKVRFYTNTMYRDTRIQIVEVPRGSLDFIRIDVYTTT